MPASWKCRQAGGRESCKPSGVSQFWMVGSRSRLTCFPPIFVKQVDRSRRHLVSRYVGTCRAGPQPPNHIDAERFLKYAWIRDNSFCSSSCPLAQCAGSSERCGPVSKQGSQFFDHQWISVHGDIALPRLMGIKAHKSLAEIHPHRLYCPIACSGSSLVTVTFENPIIVGPLPRFRRHGGRLVRGAKTSGCLV